MIHRSLLPFLISIFVYLLIGCNGNSSTDTNQWFSDSGTDSSQGNTTIKGYAYKYISSSGKKDILVTDSAINNPSLMPEKNATVKIEGEISVTTTDENGKFSFSSLTSRIINIIIVPSASDYQNNYPSVCETMSASEMNRAYLNSQSLHIFPQRVIIQQGLKRQFRPVLKTGNAYSAILSNVNWSATNQAGSFDSNGIFTAQTKGECRIRAKSGNFTGYARVKVTDTDDNKGSIHGYVTLGNNAINGAIVKLEGIHEVCITNSRGEHSLSGIPEGTYKLTVINGNISYPSKLVNITSSKNTECNIALDSSIPNPTPSQYPNWMADHKTYIQNMYLTDIVIPGSHDAATYAINSGNPYCNGFVGASQSQSPSPSPSTTATPSQSHNPYATNGDVQMCKTQSGTIMDQLLDGVRYFVFEVSDQTWICPTPTPTPLPTPTPAYWTAHMYLSAPFSLPSPFPAPIPAWMPSGGGVLNQIVDFLNSHTGEIVILDFNKIFTGGQEAGQGQAKAFYSYLFNNQLLPRSWIYPCQPNGFTGVTLGNIWNANCRIVIIGDQASDISGLVFDETQWLHSDFFDEQDCSALLYDLTNELESWQPYPLSLNPGPTESPAASTVPPPGKLRVLQAMTTTNYKITNAALTNQMIYQALMTQPAWYEYLGGCIIQMDDSVNPPANFDIMPLVIQKNKTGIWPSPSPGPQQGK